MIVGLTIEQVEIIVTVTIFVTDKLPESKMIYVEGILDYSSLSCKLAVAFYDPDKHLCKSFVTKVGNGL